MWDWTTGPSLRSVVWPTVHWWLPLVLTPDPGKQHFSVFSNPRCYTLNQASCAPTSLPQENSFFSHGVIGYYWPPLWRFFFHFRDVASVAAMIANSFVSFVFISSKNSLLKRARLVWILSFLDHFFWFKGKSLPLHFLLLSLDTFPWLILELGFKTILVFFKVVSEHLRSDFTLVSTQIWGMWSLPWGYHNEKVSFPFPYWALRVNFGPNFLYEFAILIRVCLFSYWRLVYVFDSVTSFWGFLEGKGSE